MKRPSQQLRNLVKVGLGLAALLMILSPLLDAQVKAPSAILNQYRGQRTAWFTAVWPFANTLFGLLATIEFAWSAAVMLLSHASRSLWPIANGWWRKRPGSGDIVFSGACDQMPEGGQGVRYKSRWPLLRNAVAR